MKLLAIDIGYKNFALSIEECPVSLPTALAEEYLQLPPEYQKKVKGATNVYVDDILKKLYLGCKQCFMEVCDFEGSEKEKSLSIQTRKNLIHYLEKHKELWAECDDIIIEQQYVKSGGTRFQANFKAVRLGEITLGWFLANFPQKNIVFFGSENKTQILGAPYSIRTKPQRKAWSCQKAEEIFRMRGETDILQLYQLIQDFKGKRKITRDQATTLINEGKTCITSDRDYVRRMAINFIVKRQKMDDVSDCLIMGMAYLFRKYIGKF